MSVTAIEIRPLSGSLGAEVHGVDLARPLDAETFGQVERAFLDRLVLFFRGQELTPAQQVAVAARFGPVGRYPLAEPIPEHPDIIAVVKEPGQTTNFGGIWHSDTAYLETPSLGSLLYAKEVPARGGSCTGPPSRATARPDTKDRPPGLAGRRGIPYLGRCTYFDARNRLEKR